MTILIWDLDWFYKISKMPNTDCMRLSSYHKQKGANVKLVTNQFDLGLEYDRLYIARESDNADVPPRKLLDDVRTRLIGKGFQYYGAKTISSVVTACRPDYLLYGLNETKSQYTNANFVTFFNGTTLITNRQDFHNTAKYRKKTVVTDDYLWRAPDNEIIFCLDELKHEKNIAFLKPISLGRILSNTEIQQKFLDLHFSTGTVFKWKNDWSSTDVQPIIDFIMALKECTRSNLGFIPIKTVLLNHYEDKNNFNLDWARCFDVVSQFKQSKIECLLVAPKDTKLTPYLHHFEGLEYWTKHFPKLSYVEYVLHNVCVREGVLWNNILNDPMKWKTSSIDFLLHLLSSEEWENYRKCFFIQWDDDELNQNKVNFKMIQKYINLIYKDYKDNE